jgi:hypothetical protein
MNLPGFTALPSPSTSTSRVPSAPVGSLLGASRPTLGMPWDQPSPDPNRGERGCVFVWTEPQSDCAGLVSICHDVYICDGREVKRHYPCGMCFGIGKSW